MATRSYPIDPYIDSEHRIKAARQYAQRYGISGRRGGWIYSPDGRPLTQGWDNFYFENQRAILDLITAEITAFMNFQALISTAPSYRPTLLPRSWKEQLLADAYDVAMHRARDPRRAYRGTATESRWTVKYEVPD